MSLNRTRRVVPAFALAGALLAVMLAGAAGAASPPVGDWRMNEGSGTTLVDSSASGNNGTILGNPTWVAGQHGQAIRFDGTGDYATVPDSASLDISSAITMAAWMKTEKTVNTTQYLIKKANTTGTTANGYELSLSAAGKVFVRFNQATSADTYRINSTTSYPLNGSAWMHVAATYDGTTMKLYVNGVQEGGNLAGPASIATNNLALGIGAQPDGVSQFQGAMDDVLLYNTALTGAEIAALAGITPPNTPPTLDPIGNKSAQVGTQLAFTATASDPDAGTTLTFSLANGTGGSVPAGASITSGGSFTWTPTAGQVGGHTFDVCVSDGTASDCETITVAVAGLVGDWKANEGSGATLVNSSSLGATNNATILGNPTWVAGQHGQAIRFDGTGDYATVGDNASLDIAGAITMATWVKPEKVATQYLMKKAIQGGTDGYELSLATTGFAFVRFNSTASGTTYRVDSPTAYPSNGTTWVHLAATSDGTTIRLYVNGAQVATKPAPPAITTNNLALGIGSQADGVSTLQGAMDDVLLYNRALSASEIAALATTNTPPTLDPVGDKNATAETELSFTATASDPDAGTTLTFSLAGTVPAGATIGSSSGAFSWTPTSGQVGPHTFDVCVSDGSASDCETITVTVAAANTPPTLDPVGDKNATAETELSFTATASDPDAGTTLTFSLAGTVPAGATIGSSSGAFSWTPTSGQVGPHTFDVCVSDGSASDCETITVTVAAANTPPTLDPVGDKNATAETELSFTATASDPDAGTTLTFSLAGTVPAGATIGSSSGAFSWTPTSGQVGPHTFDVCVSDGSASDCETITVTVAAANTPPTLDPVGDKNATAETELSFTATASDPDAGTTLTFSLAGTVPAGATIGSSSGAFSWTPTSGQVGPHTFDVCVSDGSASDCETITVTVAAANTPPTLDPVGDKNATAETELSFTATASDPDAGTTLTFSLAGTVPAGATIGSSSGAFSWTPTSGQVGPHTFDVCVSDGSASDCETITVTVAAVGSPQPPVADFDGNGTTDISVFRPSDGGWYAAGQPPFPLVWGTLGDLSVPGDYDGNGTTDIAVFRNGEWYVEGQPPYPQIWGQAGDVPVPGDYDGNGTTDIAVFRNGEWYVQGQPPFPQIWGQAGDVPVPGDYDGNGTTDIAVFRNGEWYVQGQPPFPQIWGQAGDVPVPGDYDGNGTTDIAVFRNGEWYVQGQPPFPQIWGQAGDVPVPGDYDGNGTTDIAVFRNGEWYVEGQPPYPQIWGTNCDIPQQLPYAIRTLIPHGGCSDG